MRRGLCLAWRRAHLLAQRDRERPRSVRAEVSYEWVRVCLRPEAREGTVQPTDLVALTARFGVRADG